MPTPPFSPFNSDFSTATEAKTLLSGEMTIFPMFVELSSLRVSLPVSMDWVGVKRAWRASTSMPVRDTSTAIKAIHVR